MAEDVSTCGIGGGRRLSQTKRSHAAAKSTPGFDSGVDPPVSRDAMVWKMVFRAMTLMANPETISFDTVLTNMLKAGDGVSDLLFVVGRPPQVEVFGKLRPVEFPASCPRSSRRTLRRSRPKLMGDNERLKADLKNNGSCDTSYAVPNVARFRVNIFKTERQSRDRHAQAEHADSDLRRAQAAADFQGDHQGKDRHRFRHRRDRSRQDDDARGHAQRAEPDIRKFTW